MEISVIITSWNTQSLLLECIESVFNETRLRSVEVIVVDNGSTDGTPEAVRENFPDVKLVCNNGNIGFAKANNIGLQLSTGRYLCLVNSDVRILKGCLDDLCDYLDQNQSVGIVGPRVLNSDLTVQHTCRRFPTLWSAFCCAVGLDRIFPRSYRHGEARLFYAYDEICEVEVLTGCFLMVKREAFSQVGLLNEVFFFYGEDLDWCKRFWNAGWKIVFFPNCQAIHHGRASSSHEPVRFAIEEDRANLQYWKEHNNRLSRYVLLCIIFLHHAIRIGHGLFSYFLKRPKSGVVMQEMKKNISCIRWLLSSQIGNTQAEISGWQR